MSEFLASFVTISGTILLFLPLLLSLSYRCRPAVVLPDRSTLGDQIGIGAAVTRRPSPHHRAYGSVTRQIEGVTLVFLEQ